jgi:Family of unknown function (DUF6318)
MRRALGAAVTSALCCLALSSCSHNADTATPSHPSTMSRGSAAPTSASPDASPRATEPVMPALARQHSTAGAKAFIRHYIAVINYAFARTDPSPLQKISASNCVSCKQLISISARLARRGGKQVGGEWTSTSIRSSVRDGNRRFFIVDAQVGHGYSVGNATGPKHVIRAHRIQAQLQLVWHSSHWLLVDLGPA